MVHGVECVTRARAKMQKTVTPSSGVTKGLGDRPE